jgi:hypothetical protein
MFPFHFVLSSHSQHEWLRGEAVTKHGKAADGFLLCGFVLQHIPVLSQETVFESDNVSRDPGCGLSDS